MDLNFQIYHPDALFFKNGQNIPVKYQSFAIAGGAVDTVFITAVTGKKIRVVQLNASSGGATSIAFRTKPAGAGTYITHSVDMQASVPFQWFFNPAGWFETASGEGLSGVAGAVALGGLIGYIEVD